MENIKKDYMDRIREMEVGKGVKKKEEKKKILEKKKLIKKI